MSDIMEVMGYSNFIPYVRTYTNRIKEKKQRQLIKCIYNLLVFSLQGIPAKKKLV